MPGHQSDDIVSGSNCDNDNYLAEPNDEANYSGDDMDETDSPKKDASGSQAECSSTTSKSIASDSSYGDRSKLLCTSNNKASGIKRPGQVLQIRTDANGARTIDHEDEVGECKISTITLSSDIKALEKKIEYISDGQLNQMSNGMLSKCIERSSIGKSYETLSDDCLPTTTKRSQNELIQFIFTSTGIRVISDKEYVV